jgi:hypothetical protein
VGGAYGNHEDEEKCNKAFDEKETFCDINTQCNITMHLENMKE